MKRTSSVLGLIGLSALLFACSGEQQSSTVQASASTERSTALGVQELQLPAPEAAVDPRLRRASGPVDVWVALDQNSLARARAMLAESTGVARKRAQASTSGEGKPAASAEPASIAAAMKAQRAAILAQQTAMAASLSGLGAKELARVSVAHNAIAITVDAERIAEIAKMPGVRSVRPVIHYELHLGATVPYIGAAAVQAAGFDGTGVKVAVLDSGIDYTHRNLGGAGTLAAYAAAYGAAPGDPLQTTRDGLFPTAKVIDGFDFVGEAWPSGSRTEDPDPIDFEGHGTHVADIIAGKSADGAHKGVAPGASLYAVKTCSAVSSSCNGIALLKGMDFALDPNGDSDLSDAADVINMSLGSSYGQIEDDLTLAASNAVALGTIVVASAGNSADRPYIVGSPSIAPGAISVAQTQVPSAVSFPVVVNSPPAIAGVYPNTATVDWAPIGAGATGDVKTALQAGGANNLACTALPAGSLAGKIALIDRGSCAISIKVDNAAKAGAIGALIALIAPGDAVTFSFGGGDTFVPTLVIQQSLGNAIKGQLASVVNVSMSPASALPLVGSMVGSSSRGPSFSLQTIKPEIGAPGASVSAIAGAGDGTGAFGGTSGAAPMVAGAAALLVQANPSRSPVEIKAMLMNSAETTIYTNPATLPGVLAPISRIGAGEVRVNRALALKAAAWDQSTLSAGLSFGQVEAERQITVSRTLRVQNFENAAKTFQIASSFRYADDAASNAVVVQAPGSVSVPANGSADVTVTLLINPTRLPNWTLDGGSNGGNGALLNGPEYDGYLTLTSGGQTLSVPWHVLPRRAAKLVAGPYSPTRSGSNLTLLNSGAAVGDFDLFSLVGVSPQLPGPLPGPGSNAAVVDLKSVGVRYLPASVFGGDYLQFAISTYGRRSHPNYPAEFDVYIDTNNDGTDDFVVYNLESGSFGATGQNVVALVNLVTGTGAIYFFADADLVSGNMIFTVPMNASAGTSINLGVAPGTTIGVSAYAFDNYFTGFLTDSIVGMKFTPGNARFQGAGATQFGGSVAIGASARIPFVASAVPDAKTSETGLLLMYRRNAVEESQGVVLPVPAGP